jgi:hypothetical protein
VAGVREVEWAQGTGRVLGYLDRMPGQDEERTAEVGSGDEEEGAGEDHVRATRTINEAPSCGVRMATNSNSSSPL